MILLKKLVKYVKSVDILGLTQLAGDWGCLGGRSPPKHPQLSLELRNS